MAWPLCKINTRTFEVSRIALKNSNAIIRHYSKDRDGNIWIGTADGLVRFGKKLEVYTSENSKLSHNMIRSIHQDQPWYDVGGYV